MDAAAVLALVTKGLTIIATLVEAGRNVQPALQALVDLVTKHEQGTVTQADLDATEALLDAQIADFNTDLP